VHAACGDDVVCPWCVAQAAFVNGGMPNLKSLGGTSELEDASRQRDK
jgi:hypothetical protein